MGSISLDRQTRRIRIDDMPGIRMGSRIQRLSDDAPVWSVAAFTGRLVELSGATAPAVLTAAVRLAREAQAEREPVAWITRVGTVFFPPDVAEHGIDLAALAVVRAPDELSIGKAAYTLVRSGAFGLIVLDMGRDAWMPIPTQARLVRFAQLRDTAVVCLTVKGSGTPSLGSLVSLRGEVRRKRIGGDVFSYEVEILKDKHRAPTWAHREECRGPVGLP